MSNATRRAEFFALEANEYLADLDQLATARDRPDAERLVRGARALRGAALMAGLGTYARAAAGLEAIARQVRDHALAWEPNARDAWSDGLATLRALVLRAPTWEAADDRQALTLAERFEQVIHGRPGRPAAPPPTALTPGVRAFIARESALIAGSFEQASRALAPIPPAAALGAVLERLQSLRGLGASAELTPLPELLDAMEVATRALLADVPAPPNVAAVFADAAHALSAMARSVADSGRISAPPELDSIARRLLESYASEGDVVPIAALAPAGAESIVTRGAAPSALPEGDPVPVELVSVGDHLLVVAEALARPTSPAARDLRLFVLHRTLAAMPSRSATGRFLEPLAHAITSAIGQHVATERADAFVAMLRGCGRFLVDAAAMSDRQALTNRRDAIATSLVMVGLGAPAGAFEGRDAAMLAPATVHRRDAPAASQIPAAGIAPDRVVDIASLAPEPAPVDADVVEISSLAPDELGIVDIASLAPAEDEHGVVSIESLAPDPQPAVYLIPAEAPGVPSRLELAFTRQRMLARQEPDRAPSIEGLIGAEVVAIASLLYRGPAALARAESVRSEVAAMLAGQGVTLDQVRPLIDELLDLVPMVRDAA